MKRDKTANRTLLHTLVLGFLMAFLSIMALGQTGWSLAVGGPEEEKIHDMAPTADGGFVLAGSTGSFGAGGLDLYVLKFDAAGNLTWDAAYGGNAEDKAYAVVQTLDGGFAVAGYTDSFGFGQRDLWVLKLDGDGAVEWQKVYGGDSLDWAYDIIQTADGGYAVCGATYTFGGGRRDAWFLKLDASGAVVWQKVIGKSNEDWAYRIYQTEDLGYITCGLTESGPGGGLDGWVAKLDSTGMPEWQKAFGNLNWEYLYYIRPVSQGGYIAAGAIQGQGGMSGLGLSSGIWQHQACNCIFFKNPDVHPKMFTIPLPCLSQVAHTDPDLLYATYYFFCQITSLHVTFSNFFAKILFLIHFHC